MREPSLDDFLDIKTDTDLSKFLDENFPVPTGDELADYWNELHGANASCIGKEVLGIVDIDDFEGIEDLTVISDDLCENRRLTLGMLADSIGGNENWLGDAPEFNYQEMAARYLEMTDDVPLAERIMQAYIATAMNLDMVQPVPGLQEVQRRFLCAREQGAVIIANTASLTGTEFATARWLHANMGGVYSGVLFPRGHKGDSKGKGHAVATALSHAGVNPTEAKAIIHFDDKEHHRDQVRLTFPESNVITPNMLFDVHEDRAPSIAAAKTLTELGL